MGQFTGFPAGRLRRQLNSAAAQQVAVPQPPGISNAFRRPSGVSPPTPAGPAPQPQPMAPKMSPLAASLTQPAPLAGTPWAFDPATAGKAHSLAQNSDTAVLQQVSRTYPENLWQSKLAAQRVAEGQRRAEEAIAQGRAEAMQDQTAMEAHRQQQADMTAGMRAGMPIPKTDRYGGAPRVLPPAPAPATPEPGISYSLDRQGNIRKTRQRLDDNSPFRRMAGDTVDMVESGFGTSPTVVGGRQRTIWKPTVRQQGIDKAHLLHAQSNVRGMSDERKLRMKSQKAGISNPQWEEYQTRRKAEKASRRQNVQERAQFKSNERLLRMLPPGPIQRMLMASDPQTRGQFLVNMQTQPERMAMLQSELGMNAANQDFTKAQAEAVRKMQASNGEGAVAAPGNVPTDVKGNPVAPLPPLNDLTKGGRRMPPVSANPTPDKRRAMADSDIYRHAYGVAGVQEGSDPNAVVRGLMHRIHSNDPKDVLTPQEKYAIQTYMAANVVIPKHNPMRKAILAGDWDALKDIPATSQIGDWWNPGGDEAEPQFPRDMRQSFLHDWIQNLLGRGGSLTTY